MVWQEPLPRSFYQRKTVEVAKDLLGKMLLREYDGELLGGIITEAEAYLGTRDPACHSYRGRTPRVAPMFEAGGVAYVYFIYGMYCCFNVVTEKEGIPEAVLIRKLHPVHGIPTMKLFRKGRKNLTEGPGVLCEALKITREFSGHPLQEPPLWIGPGVVIQGKKIHAGPRIGVDYAGEAAQWLLRFWIDFP